MPEPEKSLYHRLGGYDAVAAFVDELLLRLTADPHIGVYWKGKSKDSMKRQRQLVVDFLCAGSGGPVHYLGRDIKTSHEGLRISEDEWTMFVQHAVASLEELRVAEKEKNEFLAFVASLHRDIVEAAQAPGAESLKRRLLGALLEIKTETKFLWQELTNHIDDDSPFRARIRGRTLKAIETHLTTLRDVGVQYEMNCVQFDSKSGDDVYEIFITRTTPALWTAVKAVVSNVDPKTFSQKSGK